MLRATWVLTHISAHLTQVACLDGGREIDAVEVGQSWVDVVLGRLLRRQVYQALLLAELFALLLTLIHVRSVFNLVQMGSL